MVDARPGARTLGIVATSLGTFISSVSNSVANVALPTIAHDLHVTASASIWVINAAQLATTATLLFFASAGDSRGAHRLYIAGSIVFTLASIGSAFAHDFNFLVAMRVLGGLAGSAMIVTTQTLNRALFPPSQLGRAIAVNTIFVAVGTVAGPTLGGLVLAVADWRFVFGILIPFGAITVALGLLYLPRTPATHAPLDIRSAVFAALGCGGLFYALDGIARRESLPLIAAITVVGVVALGAFIRRQGRVPHPLLAVELFRDPIFTIAVLASAATYAAQTLAYVALPFYFQSVLGHTPFVAGLLMAAWPATTLVLAWRMGPLSDRYPAPLLCTIGIGVMGLGILSFALLPAQPATWAIVVCAALAGAGFGAFQTPNNRALIIAAPPEKTGRATGVMAIARLSGQTLGASLVAIIFELAGSFLGSPSGVPGRGVIEATLIAACGFIALAAIGSSLRLRRSANYA